MRMEKINRKIKIVYILTSCRKTGPVQQTLNIIKYLDRKAFEATLITLYDETENVSQLKLFEPYVKVINIPTKRSQLVLGQTIKLRTILKRIKPDVIHSHGVLPDYAVARIGKYKQIHTMRNYMWDDYTDKYGLFLGNVMTKLTLYTNRHAEKTLVCSKSLSDMYMDRKGMKFDYIQNGIDIDDYCMPEQGEKEYLREQLNLPKDAFLFIYTGSFLARKNLPFLLDVFHHTFSHDSQVYLILLGDGADKPKLQDKYKKVQNIVFCGSRLNVGEYLKACDAFVSASISEGLPNSVLEALASGLPVVLSDILQHLEIISGGREIGEIGYSYVQGDKHDLSEKLKMMAAERRQRDVICRRVAQELFSAEQMSRNYQELYLELGKDLNE